jgi:hypothetical protein
MNVPDMGDNSLIRVFVVYRVRATGLKKLIPQQPMRKYIQRMRRTLIGGNVGIG